MAVIRWWLHLQHLKWQERRIEYLQTYWPDENLGPVLEFVRYARTQAETYPPNKAGSR